MSKGELDQISARLDYLTEMLDAWDPTYSSEALLIARAEAELTEIEVRLEASLLRTRARERWGTFQLVRGTA